MLPLLIIFGAEMGRIMLVIIVGAMWASVFVLDEICKANGFDYHKIIDSFSNVRSGVMICLLFVFALIAALISCKISTAIMQKKEY